MCLWRNYFCKTKNDFLKKVKKLTHENNAVLIFDEIVIGFRFVNSGTKELFPELL